VRLGECQDSEDPIVTNLLVILRERPNYVQVMFNSNLGDVLDLSKPMAFLVHGWFDDVNKTWVKTTIADYVKFVDTNACAVDWSMLARVDYAQAASRTQKVGQHLAKFIELLRDNGISFNDVTIVGHSMGAHIAGFAGEALKGSIREIIGLDPAGPGQFFRERGRLDPTDAKFVQAIHTDQGFLGTTVLSGHQDYYPNNGMAPLPGCLVPILQNGMGYTPTVCSHFKAVEYFWASLNPDNKVKGVKCPNYLMYQMGGCDSSATDNFGLYAERTINGTFHFTVKSTYPFIV
jgi:pimeloyl-ACP methyl ester carboxylesterase